MLSRIHSPPFLSINWSTGLARILDVIERLSSLTPGES